MNRNTHRMLAVGVSMLALAPAVATAATTPGVTSPAVAAAPSVTDTLELSAIAAVPLGVDGPTPVTVDTTAEGEVIQLGTATAVGGVADLSITNIADFTIQAIVTGAPATASASIETAVGQYGYATAAGGTVSLSLDNSAGLNITVDAQGTVDATANVDSYGIYQSAEADSGAVADLANTGAIAISANAGVAGTAASAEASASIEAGIYQTADVSSEGDASVTLTNAGSIDISSVAKTVTTNAAGDADAVAEVGTGIDQYAYADEGSATISLINDAGTAAATAASINIGADATATGNAASADASVESGIYQYATGVDPENEVRIGVVNTGSIAVTANAKATGAAGQAYATADVDNGIYQSASGESGADTFVDLTNSGTINITAAAVAAGTAGTQQSASAYVESGIYQSAEGDEGADASVALSNSGAINIAATANASGPSPDAYASVTSGIYQSASAESASGSVLLSNDATGTIDITASAVATPVGAGATAATASAYNYYGIEQYADAENADQEANATITNAGSIAIGADASVVAGGTDAYAYAYLSEGISQTADADDGADATATITNTGSLAVTAAGNATAATEASAYAYNYYGIYQSAEADSGGAAHVMLENSGALDITAAANAVATDAAAGDAFAYAYLYSAISQQAEGSEGSASVDLANTATGVINLTADATAAGLSASAEASNSYAISQEASAELGDNSATIALTNDGAINVEANANASGGTATADAYLYEAVYQDAEGDTGADAAVDFTNTGTFNIAGVANATGTVSAEASASVESAIMQYASATNGGDASVALTNSGTLDIASVANANGPVADAEATLDYAISQTADADEGAASVLLSNASTGVIDVAASANAVGVATATADADIFGVYQSAEGQDGASVTVDNSGSISFAANAVATAATAEASATATGFSQYVSDAGTIPVVTFNNTGSVNVTATADANATVSGEADAYAYGLFVENDGPAAVLDINNAGTFNVAAMASALTSATAEATGISVTASGADAFAGGITNSGSLVVSAAANASGTTAAQVGSADAIGIYLETDVNDMTLANTGTIDVWAMTDTGGTQSATAILVSDNGAPVGAGGGEFIIDNAAGSIIARVSDDLGMTWTHGVAVDTTAAPNDVTFLLTGDGTTYGGITGVVPGDYGYIYGDIVTSTTLPTVFSVTSGETWLDGDINSAGNLFGAMTIDNGGLLFLLDDQHDTVTAGDFDGPSKVYVDSLVIGDTAGGTTGTLALQLLGADTTNYPQVFANTVDLQDNSVLEVRPASVNGLYGDGPVHYEDVVTAMGGAGSLTGTFSDVTTTSLFLEASADYSDADGTVDLDVSRVAFDALPGLTYNQSQVAGGIEGTYDADPVTGLSVTNPDYAGLVASLFTYGPANQAGYQDALDQLSGQQYASYLRNLSWMGTRFNGLMRDMSECAVGVVETEICRSPGTARVWGEFNYGKVDTDGDLEAGGFDSKQYFGALGVDFAVTENLILGVAGAYIENNTDFDLYNGKIKSDGWQGGIYANYDVGSYYIKGSASYSDLNADSIRDVAVGITPGFTTAAAFSATLVGSPDASIWSMGAEAGYRIPLGETATFTPYLGVDYSSTDINGFTEETIGGLEGAALTVDGSDEYFTTTLGGELSATFGKVTPYLRAAWQHNFSDRVADFDGAFASAPAGTSFNIISEEVSRESALVEAGLSARLSPAFAMNVGYQGRFNSDVERHAGGITLSYLFGASEPAAPPPPAPPPPPPPPPPAPEVVCNKGPYIVFFDWDRSDITAEAATILDSAVTAYGNCDVVPIMLAGYADRSGSTQYNVGLSQRRNASVRDYLSSRGIPNERISSEAFGEANPRVPTADGVRELQNRRVEITYGPGSGM